MTRFRLAALAGAAALAILATAAHANPYDAMDGPMLDASACKLRAIGDHIRGLSREAGANPGLRPAQQDALLAQHTDMLRQVSELAAQIRERQRALEPYKFTCIP